MRTATFAGPVGVVIAALGLALAGCGPQPLSVQNHPIPPTPDIEDAWVQLPPPSATTAEAYMTITGPAVDVELVRVTSPDASRVTLYAAVGPSGANAGRPVPEILIPAHSAVQIGGASGFGVLLEGITTTLVAHQTLELDVYFDDGVWTTVEAEVRP